MRTHICLHFFLVCSNFTEARPSSQTPTRSKRTSESAPTPSASAAYTKEPAWSTQWRWTCTAAQHLLLCFWYTQGVGRFGRFLERSWWCTEKLWKMIFITDMQTFIDSSYFYDHVNVVVYQGWFGLIVELLAILVSFHLPSPLTLTVYCVGIFDIYRINLFETA